MSHRFPIARQLTRLAAGLLTALALVLALPSGASAAEAGMQLHALWSDVDRTEMERQMKQAADAGATVVRLDLGWSSLQSEGKGRWNQWHLDRLDDAVDAAQELGIRPLMLFSESPCWASSAPASAKAGCDGKWWDRGVQQYLPEDPEEYGAALAFLVKRYGERVAGWEMWNEPNLDHFLRGAEKAKRYTALVKAAYRAAKPYAPNVPLIAGALSETDVAFAEELYDAGIKGSFDAFSVHPYAHDASPLSERRSEGYRLVSFAGGVPAIRELMLRHGDDKPLWLTEFGWSTSSVRGPNVWENGVSEERQATYLRQALEHVGTWDYVPVALAYMLKDNTSDKRELVGNYGLTRRDGTPKPALAAFRAGAAALRAGAAPAAARPAAAPSAATGPSLELTVPGSTAPAAVSSPLTRSEVPAQAAEGAASSIRMAGDERPRLAVVKQPGAKVRARGRAPGARRVVVEVRRSRSAGGRKRRGKPVVRRPLRVSASGRYALTFSVGKLSRGAYEVALRGTAGADPAVLLQVR